MKQIESLSIGIFSESFEPVANGVAVSIATQRQSLELRGHTTFVFAPKHPKSNPDETDVFRFPSIAPPGAPEYPLALPFLPTYLLRNHRNLPKLHLVHTHTPFVLGCSGLWYAKQNNLPIVSTYHTLYSQYVHYVHWIPKRWVLHRLERHLQRYYNCCDLVVCPSKVAMEDLRSKGVTTPIEIVPTGVPLPDPAQLSTTAVEKARDYLGVPKHQKIVLYVGRLSPEKNLYALLDIFIDVLEQIPEARLVLMGWGTERGALEHKVIRLGLRDRVSFPPPLPRSQMDSIFACADVFCLTSTSETQGLVVDEARGAGLPIVVASEGGAAESVCDGQDGYVVSAKDHASFVAHIISLLTNSELRSQFIANGRVRVLENSPERMAERLEALYQQVLNAKSPLGERT